MSAGTAATLTATGPSWPAQYELNRPTQCTFTMHSSFRVPVKDGNRLPLTDTEGADVDAVRCPYCNLPMFVERTTRHCHHCDWRQCPACVRWYSLAKAPAHETE